MDGRCSILPVTKISYIDITYKATQCFQNRMLRGNTDTADKLQLVIESSRCGASRHNNAQDEVGMMRNMHHAMHLPLPISACFDDGIFSSVLCIIQSTSSRCKCILGPILPIFLYAFDLLLCERIHVRKLTCSLI